MTALKLPVICSLSTQLPKYASTRALNHLARFLCLATGVTFTVSGILKVLYSDEFATAVATYHFLPPPSGNLIVLLVAWVEVLCGLMLLLGLQTRVVGIILTVLLFAFVSTTALEISRGRIVDCGCFPMPGRSEKVGLTYFLRNISLSCLAFGCR
jgi:uncharacterized membrane protein